MGGGRGRKLLTLCGRFLRLHLSMEKEGNEDLPESEWVSKEAGYKHAGGGGDGRGSQQKLMVIQMTSLTKVAGNQRLLPPNPQKQKKMGGAMLFPSGRARGRDGPIRHPHDQALDILLLDPLHQLPFHCPNLKQGHVLLSHASSLRNSKVTLVK